MEEIITVIKQWKYPQELAVEIAGMAKRLIYKEENGKYYIFAYEDEARHRAFTLFYDSATKDYMGRITIGLTDYIDVKYIVTAIDAMEEILHANMESTLQSLHSFEPAGLSSVFLEKNILFWPYAKSLPAKLAGFELFIRPAEPVMVINGSYLILDYSHFASESNFMVYYNIYRDEFFAEIRVRRTPETTAEFDAHTLDELAEKLENGLQVTLLRMMTEIKSSQA